MKKVIIVIWTVIAIFLTVALVNLIIFGDKIDISAFEISYKERAIVFDKTYEDNIDNINLKWRSGDVNIYKNTEENIRVVQKSSKELTEDELVKVNIENGTIKIEEGNKKIRFFILGFGTLGTEVDVYLPEKQYNEIQVKLSSGQIVAEKINCDKFICNLTSGDIEISELNSNSTDIDVTSGKIIVNKLETDSMDVNVMSGDTRIEGVAKNVNLKTTSGRIDFKDEILPEKLDVNVTSGDIKIDIPENEGFNVDYNITSGDFKSDFELMYSSNSKRNGMAKYKNGGNEFIFRVTSGQIKLNKK